LELLNYFEKLLFNLKNCRPLKVPPSPPLLRHCFLTTEILLSDNKLKQSKKQQAFNIENDYS